MVFAGGLCQFCGFMEVMVLFKRVNSPCQIATESYFPSIVLLQTVYKPSVYYTTSSSFSVYTAGEFFLFSDLTFVLVVIVSFFPVKVFIPIETVLILNKEKERRAHPMDPSVKVVLKRGTIGRCL
jgi:hypothetical protein